jgi:hypothetical protein
MSLKFSEAPGAFERQLQRQHRNPLFPAPAQLVTQDHILAAHRRDQEEQRDFQAALRATLREALDMPPQVESDVLLKLKERLDQLYDQCAGLPGDHDREKQSLTRMIGVIMKAVWSGAGDDPRARSELEQEEHARTLHHELLREPLVATLLRPDSPIAEDALVPTLLSETEDAVRTVLQLFDATQLQALCQQARELLARLDSVGQELPEARRRLDLMEEAVRRAGLIDPAATP